MTSPAFAVATSAGLVAAAWPWTRGIDSRFSVRALATGVLAVAAVVFLQVALGLAGALRPGPLALAAWLAVALALAVRAVAGGLRPGVWPRAGTLDVTLAAFTALVYGGLVGLGLLVPPYGWDTLVYHLTDVFHTAQAGDLSSFPFPGAQFYFPKLGEFCGLWAFLLAGAGEDAWRFTGIALVPFGLLAGVSARVVTDAFGLRTGREWVFAGVATAPIVVIQPLAGYVDVVSAGLLLAAFAFLVLAVEEKRFAPVPLAALAAGLSLGTKLSFPIFAAPLLIVLASPAVVGALARVPAWRLARRAATLAVLFGAGSAPWLGANAFATGNPAYPSPVRIAGVTIFDGPRAFESSAVHEAWFVGHSLEWLVYPFRETFHGSARFTVESGFGPLFAVGLLTTLPAFAIAVRSRRWGLTRALLATPVTIAAWLALAPYREPRYAIQALGFSTLALLVVSQGAPARRSLQALVTGAIVVTGLAGLVAIPDLGRVLSETRAGAWDPRRYYELHYGDAGRAFRWIDEQPPSTVSFTNPSFLAPLFGWHGRHRVVYAPTADDPPIGGQRRVDRYEEYRAFLAAESVDWIVVWIPWWGEQGSPTAEGWIAEHPGDFALLADFGNRVRIYEPRPAVRATNAGAGP